MKETNAKATEFRRELTWLLRSKSLKDDLLVSPILSPLANFIKVQNAIGLSARGANHRHGGFITLNEQIEEASSLIR
jgi:hypothetical protein